MQGEDQKKLDVLSNEIMINALRASGKTAVLVSEENDDAIFVEGSGKYCVVFDPLDGSSNIDAGVNIGTIFGIYLVEEGSKGTLQDVLRPGTDMVAAGYCMYGSSANMVLTTGNGVNGYTLDNAIGEFILTHPNITLPPRGKIYSINEGNSAYYHEPVLKYLDSIKYPKGEGKKPYSARYIGSMVADVHRTLLYGGIFGYPEDSKSKSGKLRLLYEAFPMAMLTEQVRGARVEAVLCGEADADLTGRRCCHDGSRPHSRGAAQVDPRALPRVPRLQGRRQRPVRGAAAAHCELLLTHSSCSLSFYK